MCLLEEYQKNIDPIYRRLLALRHFNMLKWVIPLADIIS